MPEFSLSPALKAQIAEKARLHHEDEFGETCSSGADCEWTREYIAFGEDCAQLALAEQAATVREQAAEIAYLRAEVVKRSGTWPNGTHRAFVEGASWWQYHANGATAFSSERDEMEAEAVRRYGAPPDASKESA